MLNHEILTMEEEQALGKKIRRAIATKEAIATIIEEKQVLEFERAVKEEEYKRQITAELLFDSASVDGDEEYDDEGLYIYGLDIDVVTEVRRGRGDQSRIQIQSTDDYVEELLSGADGPNLSQDPIMLTDDDIKTRLGIRGGRKEVSRILIEGARARDKLISSNIRLVLSIAKKWSQNTPQGIGLTAQNKDGIYSSSWTRPSLEEAIQEGILGLATAADRYDYKRKLKFSTYATYWITNSVRHCFHSATTGSIRIPVNYHNTKQQYQKLVKAHYERTGRPLPLDQAADEMGLQPERLEFIIKSTEPLISLDAPIPNGLLPAQAGKSGSFDQNEAFLSGVISW